MGRGHCLNSSKVTAMQKDILIFCGRKDEKLDLVFRVCHRVSRRGLCNKKGDYFSAWPEIRRLVQCILSCLPSSPLCGCFRYRTRMHPWHGWARTHNPSKVLSVCGRELKREGSEGDMETQQRDAELRVYYTLCCCPNKSLMDHHHTLPRRDLSRSDSMREQHRVSKVIHT